MARTELTPTTLTLAGVDFTAQAGIADGHMFDNNGRVFAIVENTSAVATRDVTFVTTKTISPGDLAVADVTITVGISSKVVVGPFTPDTFNVKSGNDLGTVYVNYDSGNESDLEIQLYKLTS